MDRLHVATLNIRNLADRWFERLPLLLADMAALQPDLLGLQEVVYAMQQDRLIGAAGEGRYAAHRGWAGQPEYGNSMLVREPLAATAVERLDLGHKRAAHRALVGLPGGTTVLAIVTHLHHLTPDAAIRDEETAAILAWLGRWSLAEPGEDGRRLLVADRRVRGQVMQVGDDHQHASFRRAAPTSRAVSGPLVAEVQALDLGRLERFTDEQAVAVFGPARPASDARRTAPRRPPR